MFTGKNSTLKFKTEKILTKLRINREKHIKDFQEAKTIYMKALGIKLRPKLTAKVAAGEDIDFSIDLEKPVSYEKNYDRAIQMLDLCTDQELDLDGSTFSMYVMDEWDWSNRFLNNSMTYKSMKL